MTNPAAQLAGVVADAADALGVDSSVVEGGVDYRFDEVVIAEVRGGSASFRLRPDVAAAAARTPDAEAGSKGSEWVTFTPRTLDRFARDRIEAWLEFAARQAGSA